MRQQFPCRPEKLRPLRYATRQLLLIRQHLVAFTERPQHSHTKTEQKLDFRKSNMIGYKRSEISDLLYPIGGYGFPEFECIRTR